MTITEPRQQGFDAPDLLGSAWLNGEPYLLRRGEGDVVLLDFWSSTSVRSLRALPRIALWHRVYGDAGLVTIGVHTPGYSFAADRSHVEALIRQYGISYPVVLDNDARLFTAYGLRSHPTCALVDRNGSVRYVQTGDSEAVEFERSLQSLLRESGFRGELPSMVAWVDTPSNKGLESVSEMYGGYRRGSVGNSEGFVPETEQEFADPMMDAQGRFYLSGHWSNGKDSFRSAPGASQESGLRLFFEGEEVFAVLGSETNRSMSTEPMPRAQAEISLSLDGRPPQDHVRGADLSSEATVSVGEPRVYHLLQRLSSGAHTLMFSFRGGPCDVYQLTVVKGPRDRLFSTN